jgi:hypothetical protein
MSEPYNPPTAPPPTGPPAGYGPPGLPWDREKTGNSLVATAKGLITAPGAAYAEMREKGDYGSPILFAVIVGTLCNVIAQIWSLAFGAVWLGFLPADARSQIGPMMETNIAATIFSIILAPVVVLIGLFLLAAIYHLFLLIVGGTKESTAGFEGTVRALGYGHVSYLAYVIPVIGPLIGFLWSLVLASIGLSRVHHTSGGKAAAAVLLPWLLCCVCIGIAFATMGAAILSAIGANQ